MYIKLSLFLTLLSPMSYLLGRFFLTPNVSIVSYTSCYNVHAVLFFFSFFFIPALVIKLKGHDLKIYSGKRGFISGFMSYVAVTPLFILFFGSVAGPDGRETDFIISYIFVTLNVSSVDFYIRRIHQLPLELEFSKSAGVLVGFVSWMIFHIPETLWLLPYGGLPNTVGFMAFTGLLFSYIYSKTGDISGFIVGHSFLNLILGISK
jgi:hypothetical protein